MKASEKDQTMKAACLRAIEAAEAADFAEAVEILADVKPDADTKRRSALFDAAMAQVNKLSDDYKRALERTEALEGGKSNGSVEVEPLGSVEVKKGKAKGKAKTTDKGATVAPKSEGKATKGKAKAKDAAPKNGKSDAGNAKAKGKAKAEADGDGFTDLLSESVEMSLPYDVSRLRASTRPMLVDLLLTRVEGELINLSPSYQRRSDLWSRAKSSRLIESLIMGIPLPAWYVFEAENGVWSVIDGAQRTTALVRHVANNVRLIGLEFLSDLNGKRFSDLPSDLQTKIRETALTFHVIESGSPAPVQYHVFRRLNTGGLKLSAQEIRSALCVGPALDTLHEMADLESFQLATDGGVNPRRQADIEVCLRFAAFARQGGSDGYTVADMDGFLTSEMRVLNGEDSQIRGSLVDAFDRTMRLANVVFDGSAFRKPANGETSRRPPFSKALFDCFAVALWHAIADGKAEAIEADAKRIRERFAEALEHNDAFRESVTYSTRDVGAVKTRFEVAKNIVRGLP